MKAISTNILIYAVMVVTALSSCSGLTVETNDNFEVVILPDSTEVYLNQYSIITYNEDFSPRLVELKGEAFFSVTSMEEPFVITTELGEVTVLGTEFNVKADSEELAVEVEEGQVELKAKQQIDRIRKGEAIVYNKIKNTLEKGKAKFKFRKWKRELNRTLKVLKRSGKEAGKDFKKLGKNIKKELQ